MEEIEAYTNQLNKLACECVEAETSAYALLRDRLKEHDEAILSIVDLREELLSWNDEESVIGLLATGYFSELAGKRRVAAFVVCIDLERTVSSLSLKRRLEPYHEAQPLFSCLPDLLSATLKRELLPNELLGHHRGDGITKIGASFFRFDPYLHPSIISWSRSTFPGLPLFFRLDPYFVKDKEPPTRLLEAILIPADPSWWANLDLHPRQTAGSAYLIEPPANPRDNQKDYWDFHVRHLRRLEVHAGRREPDYFTMMVEELADFREADGFLLGRVIHWDTADPRGKAVEEANVKHLDLAINLYCGIDAEVRLGQSLARGRVQDATLRTHLLRIEGITANAVLAFAQQFFQSTSLLRDWFNDQFGLAGLCGAIARH